MTGSVVPGYGHVMSLRALLIEEGATGPEAALAVLKGSLLGLAAPAAGGVVHGDYKPENVMITAVGGIQLVGFGLASRAGRERLSGSTPFYLAPEGWGSDSASTRADLYAATVTFFECVVGAPPFHADSPAQLRRHHESTPAPLEAAPGPIRDIIGRGVAKDPDRRPTSAEDFVAELEVAAVAGYGADWEERGRGELTRLVSPPAQPFPLGMTCPPTAPNVASGVSLGRTGTVAVAAAALAVGLTASMLSGGAPNGSGSSVASGGSGDPVQVEAAPPPPAVRMLTAPEVFPTAGTAGGAGASAPDAEVLAIGAPGSSVQGSRSPAGAEVVPLPVAAALRMAMPVPVVVAPPPGRSETTPMAAPPAPRSEVTRLSIVSFEQRGLGTHLVVTVRTTGTDPVLLSLRYAGGPQGSAGTTGVQTVVMRLAGQTTYSIDHDHDFSTTCTSHWNVVLTTDPAADTGEQFAEVPAIACPRPTPADPYSAPPESTPRGPGGGSASPPAGTGPRSEDGPGG